jgi:hypothetical protein
MEVTMKSLIIALLGSALLLNSCTSFQPLEAERAVFHNPEPDKEIRVTLADDSEVEAERYHHVRVSEPSDFVYGVGKIYVLDNPTATTFAGSIPNSSIDSSRIVRKDSHELFVCWFSKGTPLGMGPLYEAMTERLQAVSTRLGPRSRFRIEFEKGDYLNVTASSGPGLWCSGTLKTSEGYTDFAGRIPFDKIKEIEERVPDAGATIGLAIGAVAGAAIALVAAVGIGLAVSGGNWF